MLAIHRLTLFLPGEGGISPLIVYHVTKSVRNRVKGTKDVCKMNQRCNINSIKTWVSQEHIGPLILEKIQFYVLTRAELLFTLCNEISCTYYMGP